VRVLHLVKTSEGAFWAVRQVKQLVSQGVDVHVALPEKEGAALPAWRESGGSLHFVDCSLPLRNASAFPDRRRAVRNLVNEVRPDLIHSHFVSTTVMLRLALGRQHATPRIFQVPGPLHMEHWPSRTLETATAGSNDYWTGSSHYIARLYHSAGVELKRIFVSYHSTDSTLFSTRRTGFLRERLDLPKNAIVVGNVNLIYGPKRFLGQRTGLKCHEDVIEAIRRVQKTRDDVWGVLIGGSFGGAQGYEQKLRRLAGAKGRGKICMPGRFNDQEVALSWPDFDCAVHVPLSENCGGVVEPLLCAVPTIAGNVGGLPEVVHPGITGKLTPIRRPELLADSLLEILDHYDTHKRLATEGQRLAAAMFDPRRCAEEILGIYRHILFLEPRPRSFSPLDFLNSEPPLGFTKTTFQPAPAQSIQIR